MDRPGLMSEVLNIVSETKLNIYALNVHTDKSKTCVTNLGLDISAVDQLNYVINKIRRLKGIYTVERIISNGGGKI